MEIKVFKAYRFNPQVVGNAGDCIAPPYDVIDADLQERLYSKNEYNIVRITRGKTERTDNENNNQYTRAAKYLNEWLDKGILKQDSKEAIYAYVQDFQIGGKRFKRGTFIALGKLEEFGGSVKAHENTLNGPKADRLNLQRATAAQFGLIFMLYEDTKKVADKLIEKASAGKAIIEFTDEDKVKHQLFAITDKADTDTICQMMVEKSCVIADGHHRYATSLNYYNETKNPNAAYQIMAFANILNEGMIILATHRLVYGLKDFSTKKLLEGLNANFNITEYKFDTDEAKQQAKKKMLEQMKKASKDNKNAYGIYTGDGVFRVAVLKDSSVMDKDLPDKSKAYRRLDVTVLHKLILEEQLKIGEKELAAKTNLEYIKDTPNAVDDTIGRVDAGKIQAAFFTSPEKMKMIQMVADAGERMPQKSTFFFPKVFSGLTIYKM
jgi:uncharacterized protein (DUF1015 family)